MVEFHQRHRCMSIGYNQNSFKAILNVIKPILDLDQVATNLHFFFKRSAARREVYKVVGNITEITTHYIKMHVESCSLSIDRSLVQILEQRENLRQYILKEIPKQRKFKSLTRKMVWQITIGIRV